jgi:predicted transposase/invertase (TIGR01784 family)
LRELYCAIKGVTLPPDTPIEINTLSDIFYMAQVNDISFTIDNRLVVLIEHQSTVNRNMPLRLLMYIARIYEKIIDRDKLYQIKLEKIPIPEFIVLYNGKSPHPDYAELKLSSAFINADDLKGENSFPLELTVQVYNINHERNPEMLKKCEALNGYSFFVEKVRENRKEPEPDDAMKKAIDYCIKHDILKKFLETHSSEVFNMLLTEWNTEEAIAFRSKEAWEDGLEEGREEREMEIARNALAKGASIEFVHEITGLDLETIGKIQVELRAV